MLKLFGWTLARSVEDAHVPQRIAPLTNAARERHITLTPVTEGGYNGIPAGPYQDVVLRPGIDMSHRVLGPQNVDFIDRPAGETVYVDRPFGGDTSEGIH